jgi:hypothetical protein
MVLVKPIVHEIKTSSPWIQRTIWDQNHRKNPNSSTPFSKVTYGQLLFGGATALSLFKMIANIFSDSDSSIWKKYIVPAAISVFGVFGIAVSTPGERNFESDLFNFGVTNVIEKMQKVLKGKDLLSTIISEDFQDNVSGYFSRMLSQASASISRLIPPDGTSYNHPIKELADLASVPDDFTLEKLGTFIEETTPREFYRMIKSEPELFGKLFYKLFDAERGLLNKEMLELENYINESVLNPYGLSANVDYNSRKKMFDINLTTTDIFSKSDKKSLYKPFIIFSLPPEKLALAIYELNLALDEIKQMSLDGEKLSDRDVLLAGIGAVAERINIGRIKAGYFVGSGTGNASASGKLVGEVKDLIYLSTKKQIRSFLGELAIGNIESPGSDFQPSSPTPSTTFTDPIGRNSTVHVYNCDDGTSSTFTDGSPATAVASGDDKPELALVGSRDGLNQTEALEQIQEEELKFRTLSISDSHEVLLLNYWLTMAYIRKQKEKMNDSTLYTMAESALNSRVDTLGLSRSIADSKVNGDVRFEKGKLVLHDKYLDLRLFNRVLGLAQDVPLLAKKRANDYMKAFELLRKDQQTKMQDEFFKRYYSGNSSA